TGLPSTNVIDQSGAGTMYQMPMEYSDDKLKEISNYDTFEAGEDMDDPFPLPANEETRPPPSTLKPSTESQHTEQPSIEHNSPSSDKDHPESSKRKYGLESVTS
ncbi:hypothetical protein Tco_0342631, partial [Tanacetum coccineum]